MSTQFPIQRNGASVVVHLPRQLVIENRRAFREVCFDEIDTGATHVILDCSETVYADSAGLGALFQVRTRALRRGGSVTLRNATGDFRGVFDRGELDQYFAFDFTRSRMEVTR